MIWVYIFGGLVVFLILVISSTIRIIKEYERAVIFRLGRYVGTRGPGIIAVIPAIEKMNRVSLRIITLDVPTQEIMTYDNVPVEVNAVVYYRIKSPEDAIIQVNNYHMATSQIAQTTLRSVLGQAELDELLAEREKINQELQDIIDEETNPWGIKVSSVEVKNVELPQSMQRAMARQAEAERERRAKIIAAEGEHQAAEKLDAAAQVIGKTSTGIQLRYLQTLTEISSEGTNTVVFPIPINMLSDIGELIENMLPDDADTEGTSSPDQEDLMKWADEESEASPTIPEDGPEEDVPPSEARTPPPEMLEKQKEKSKEDDESETNETHDTEEQNQEENERGETGENRDEKDNGKEENS